MNSNDWFGLIYSVPTFLLVIAAFWQIIKSNQQIRINIESIELIKKDLQPNLVLYRISDSNFVLYNVGKEPAYNISISLYNLKSCHPLPFYGKEYIDIRIDPRIIAEAGIADMKEDIKQLNISYDSRYSCMTTKTFNWDDLDKCDFNSQDYRQMNSFTFKSINN